MTTKIIKLKKSKKQIYKDILNNPEKIRNILKKKKTLKNYKYLSDPIIFNKNNKVIDEKYKNPLKNSTKNTILNQPNSNEQNSNQPNPNQAKASIIKSQIIENYNTEKNEHLKKNKKKINKNFRKIPKFKSSKKATRKSNKKSNKTKRKITDYFSNIDKASIKKKVLISLRKILLLKDNNKLSIYLNKLDYNCLKILCMYLNLIRNPSVKFEKSFLIKLLYSSLSYNIIIFKTN